MSALEEFHQTVEQAVEQARLNDVDPEKVELVLQHYAQEMRREQSE